jgi:SAM-dependent methyltransferase
VNAYGCEISKYSYSQCDDYIYRKRLENVYFPTDYFDIVTCHDVIEHVMEPIKFTEELFRITKQNGTCIIDMPRFFHQSGAHHWKAIEHIWYFSTEQLKDILENIGFIINEIKHPIESKTVFYLSKPKQNRPKILVPPGIGDSYWVLTKLQSFIKREYLGIPDIHIASPRDKKYEGHKRSFPFLEMFPFLNSSGKIFSCKKDPEIKKIWKEAYTREGRTIFTHIPGYDYFISYNGHLGVGKQMENIDPDLETNWYPPMFVSLEQEKFRKECENKYGKYIVFYFPFYGTYQFWTEEFPAECVAEFIRLVKRETGYTAIFVGAKWDADDETFKNVIKDIPGCINLAGKTTVEQLFGLINGSQMVVGYPSGLTIMSAVLKKKTLMIWNEYYDNDYAWHSCPPDIKNKTYFIEFTKGLLPHYLASRVIKIMTGNDIKIMPSLVEQKYPIQETKIKKRIRRKQIHKNMIPSARNIISQNKTENRDITILCVLKSGGDFDVDYVRKLKNMIARNTTIPYKFICLTDIDIDPELCNSIKLKHDYDRWWSKIEMFRHGLVKSERIIYFDLDSVILSNIDDILMTNYGFVALKPWNALNSRLGLYASGMMAWKNGGSYSFIYNQFKQDYMEKYSRGDQEYISCTMKKEKKDVIFFQDISKGIYSYKRNCKNGLPIDARIVCFHGRPRPHNVSIPWVVENWK